jgi:ribonuclease P protein component
VRVRCDPMWCSFVADSNMSPPHVAFAIGRAVGPAVTRNRLRRRLRSILGAMDVPNGLYLFGGRPSMSELTFAELETHAAALLVAAQHSRAHS